MQGALGVKATAELQHEAGQVLFAVTPASKEEALDKIRAALNVFLSLPANPFNERSDSESGVVIQRLASNIYHLKSQLALVKAQAQAMEADIKAKQTTIEAQQRIVYMQERVLRGDILLDSMTNISPDADASGEERGGNLDRIVSQGTEGLEVDLAKLFGRLRLMFMDRG